MSLVTSRSEQGFVALDERLRNGLPGLVTISLSRDGFRGLTAHVARRLGAHGLQCVVAPTSDRSPVASFLVRKLGIEAGSSVPWVLGRAIVNAARATRSALVIHAAESTRSDWDVEVQHEIVRSGQVLVIRLTTELLAADDVYRIEERLDDEALACWWAALAEEASRAVRARGLHDLDTWWTNAIHASKEDDGELATDLVAARDMLSVAGTPLAVSAFAPELVQRLCDAGVGCVNAEGHLELAFDDGLRGDTALRLDDSLLRRTAQAMLEAQRDRPCPWARVRAAELYLAAGEAESAESALVDALALVDDPLATRELHTRWFDAVSRAPGALYALAVRAATRALRAGEPDEALRWTDRAALSALGTHAVALLRGRALLLLGDFTIARVATDQALARASSDDERAEAMTLLAELAYVEGKHELSIDLVNRAMELSGRVATTLAARNVIGKVFLARAAWDEANAHFAADAMTARDHGELEAELRARVNRAIAVMSKGDLTSARSMLESALEDAAAADPVAAVCVRRNLAVVAHQQADYARAMALWDEALRYPTAIGGRASAARMIANLADLRLSLGLFDQAEHTLAFGRRAVTNPTGATASHLSVVEARLALARGDAARASRFATLAMQQAEAAGDHGDRLPDACLTAARAALLDGAVERARSFEQRARELASNEAHRAEAAIVATLIARAAGEPYLELGIAALAHVPDHERELCIEAHVLVCLAARDAGDLTLAARHCGGALAIRDTIASSLPPEIRAAMLARPSALELSQLSMTLRSPTELPPPLSEKRAATKSVAPTRTIVGDHPEMRSLIQGIHKAARTNATVLIRGESGTGKELVASALHTWSARGHGPLVSVNCAALSDTLLLSELFGHEKGAFTGAHAKKLGRFELANGGTLFLDEIGDICAKTQVALLRVLQEKTFERVGGATAIRADVRVVCATHRDLETMVERGEFRRDLYYRLEGLVLEVPPLRRRASDLPALTKHLLAQIAVERDEEPKTISADAMDLLVRHAWPGNIRELENVLRAVSVFADHTILDVANFVAHCEPLRTLAQHGASESGWTRSEAASPHIAAIGLLDPADIAYAHVRGGGASLSGLKKQIERECIVRALRETNGNISRAAVLLGLKRPRLSQIVKEYALTSAITPEQDEP